MQGAKYKNHKEHVWYITVLEQNIISKVKGTPLSDSELRGRKLTLVKSLIYCTLKKLLL